MTETVRYSALGLLFTIIFITLLLYLLIITNKLDHLIQIYLTLMFAELIVLVAYLQLLSTLNFTITLILNHWELDIYFIFCMPSALILPLIFNDIKINDLVTLLLINTYCIVNPYCIVNTYRIVSIDTHRGTIKFVKENYKYIRIKE